MKFLLLTITFLIAGAFFSVARSQSQFSGWLASFNTIKTGKRTGIVADVQWRSSDQIKHTQTLLIRAGMNYSLSKKLTATVGYAFIHNRRVINDVSGYAPEHRIWEQLLYSHKLGAIFVSHRFRLEQRFLPRTSVVNNELKNDGTLHANRFRYFIRNVLPLRKQPAAFTKGAFAALQDEVFINIGNTVNVNGKLFDQNRFYVAAGYRLNARFDLETGYLNQYTLGRNGASTRNHVVQLASYLRL